MALILASASPRRQELLARITPDFLVCPSSLDENTITTNAGPAALVQELARAKCREISALHPNDLVLGCDTVVALGGEVFGKPKDEADARRMLTALSGKMHQVITGLCLRRGSKEFCTAETTAVQFGPIAPDDLNAYLKTTEPYDKAGAYAIQGHAALWCAHIAGCYYNIMGLPVHRVAQLLQQF